MQYFTPVIAQPRQRSPVDRAVPAHRRCLPLPNPLSRAAAMKAGFLSFAPA
jgi:hypothetical protein